MKKVFILAIAIVAVLVIVGCNKVNLEGTTWKSDDLTDFFLVFNSPQKVSMKIDSHTESGEYTISGNKVTITFSGETLKGTISGNKLSLPKNDNIMTFTKLSGEVAASVETTEMGSGDNQGDLTLPPVVNLFQYSASISQHDLYGIPRARIWGWSNDGKVAYSVERGIEGRGGQIIYFVILDSVSDSEVFKLIMDSFDYNDVEDEALYNLSSVHILNALMMHNIVRQETNFLPFPFRRNNTVYDCRITNVEYKDGEGFFDGGAVSRYNVLVTAGNKSKIINSFTPVGRTGFVYVCGYFLSPFENRALVVVAEERWGHEGTELDYRLSGCHLEAGFN